MAGERGLDRDLRRLAIADLADEDDVRILPHDGAQRRAEGETGALVHLDLHDARQPILDRILDGDDVHAARLHLAQRGVERRGLAAPGGAGDEHEPLALLEQGADAREVVVAEADRVEGAEAGAAVEDADDDLLAVRRGEGGHAQVHDGAAHGDPRATVLRAHAIGDVEPGEDLHARHQRRSERASEQPCLPEHAVDPMPDGDALLLGLDVDVARAA